MDWRAPEFRGAAIINIDLDSDNNITNDLPTWIREAIELAIGDAGFRVGRKLASEEVIESLEEVSLGTIDASKRDCPICYEAFEEPLPRRKSSVLQVEQPLAPAPRAAPLATFCDPAMFVPVVESSAIYLKFPQRSLTTGIAPTLEEQLPGYVDARHQSARDRTTLSAEGPQTPEVPHTPVKMPGCGHLFGKACIVEWLKNNVSCPLCRQEVQAEARDPELMRRREIRRHISHDYVDADAEVLHLAEHLTDVLRPFKRPFNPRVTPLTDRNVPHAWAKPFHVLQQEHEYELQLASPEVGVPGMAAQPHKRQRANDPALVVARKFPVPDFGEFPFRSRATTDPVNAEISSVRDERAPLLSPLQSFLRGRGGPERPSRSSSVTRSHPYSRSRPDEP